MNVVSLCEDVLAVFSTGFSFLQRCMSGSNRTKLQVLVVKKLLPREFLFFGFISRAVNNGNEAPDGRCTLATFLF